MDEKTEKEFITSALGIVFLGIPICELASLQLLDIIFSVTFASLFIYRWVIKKNQDKEEPNNDLFDDITEDFESENKAMNNGYLIISLISEIVLPINSILWIRPLGIITSLIYLVSTATYLGFLMHFAISNFKKGRF